MNRLGTNELVRCFRQVADGWREEREKYEKRICKGLKVAIYIRCKNEKSYSEHIDRAVKYCNDMGFEIVAIEKEISPKEPDVRPRLLAAIHNKTAEAVVVSDIERISRNMERVYKYISQIYQNNKFLINASSGGVIV